MRPTHEVVQEVLALLAAVPAPAAGPTVVAVDGRSGSGKTDLAAALAERTGAVVVHVDDLYPGWSGLAAAVDVLSGLLATLRSGAVAHQPVWDWSAHAYTRTVALPTSGLVVLEGVGAGCAGPVDLLVELVADPSVRRARALARDGATFAPHWDAWAAQEAELFSRRPLRPDVTFGSATAAGAVPAWA
ncbi:hypothetical protein [Kineococcus rhizosphaerae]|uniref:Uridine kinase n=1 Tax=Kineococcus rhizosphaerae TaxID=559628 RepID=A0A2T0R9Y1_9ACTN|nr:hypothetical protein [Kineococcus rhizosphaerae]PRY17963.1 hypothetical protein CLV37_101206 [Kineococcus rhizosphaerae]